MVVINGSSLNNDIKKAFRYFWDSLDQNQIQPSGNSRIAGENQFMYYRPQNARIGNNYYKITVQNGPDSISCITEGE